MKFSEACGERFPTIPVHPEVDIAENHVEKESEENTGLESVTESDVKVEADIEIKIDDEDTIICHF